MVQRVPQRELDLHDLDRGEVPRDVAEEDRGDAHHAEVEPADGHAPARDPLQVALRDELVPDEAQEGHRPPWEHARRRDRAPPEVVQRGERVRGQLERLVAVEQTQVRDRGRTREEGRYCDAGARGGVKLRGEGAPSQPAECEAAQGGEMASVEDRARVERDADEPECKLELLEVLERPQGAI